MRRLNMQGAWVGIEVAILTGRHPRLLGCPLAHRAMYHHLVAISYRQDGDHRDTHALTPKEWTLEFSVRHDSWPTIHRGLADLAERGLIRLERIDQTYDSVANPLQIRRILNGVATVFYVVVVVGLGVKWTQRRIDETRVDSNTTTKDKSAEEVKTLKPKTPAQIQNAALVEAVKKAWDQVHLSAPLSWPLAQKFAGQCQRRDISPAWLARYVAGRRPVNPIAYAQRMLTGRERLEPNDPGSSWGRWVSDTLPAPKGLADIVAGVAGRWRVDE